MIQEGITHISLQSLAGGAAVERFNDELEAVLRNVLDVNTEAEAKRTINLSVELLPNEERTSMTIKIKCSSKVAAARAISSFGYIGQKGGKVIATEYNPKQPGLYEVTSENKEEAKS